MKFKFQHLAPIALSALIFFSCSKKNESSSLAYKLKTGNKSAVVNRLTAGAVNWTSGSAYVAKIEFEAEKNDVNEIEYEAFVNRKIDLFTPLTELASINLPDGKYDEIETEIELNTSAADTAFVLRGTFINSSSQIRPVLFYINQQLELKDEAENVTISGSDKKYTAITDFNLAMLTHGITEDMLNNAVLTDGVIIISSNSNVNLYNIMFSAIQNMDSVEIDD